MALFGRILVATDFGVSSKKAVELATELALKSGSKVALVHAYDIFVPLYPALPIPDLEPIRVAALGAMDSAIAALKPTLPNVEGFVVQGDAHSQILAKADEWKADLIVIGTHGYRGVTRLFLGSEAEKVVRLATVPVLTVHGPAVAAS